MCQCHRPRHHHPREHGHECCCHGSGRNEFQRNFYSKEEKLDRLEKYLKDLKKEVRAVEELINRVGGGGKPPTSHTT